MKTLSSGTETAFANLKKHLSSLENVAIAYSGGVDSTLLLYTASTIPDLRVVAYTIKNALIPADEISAAVTTGEKFAVEHHVIEIDILSFDKVYGNSPERCYYCKRIILKKILDEAASIGINTLIEGSHSGDISDYRPGLKAIKELGVISPLKNAGFDKSRIYELSAYLELPTADKESYPCLATRIPYGTPLTIELLQKAESAEKILTSFGFREVRARIHGDILRIEVAEKMIPYITEPSMRKNVCDTLANAGFKYITLDLIGYRTGSMNINIEEQK